MSSSTLTCPGNEPVRQFSVFVANKLGRIHDLSSLLKQHEVHILAVTVLDTTDSAILRLVVDDPERARALFEEHGFPYTEATILVVEVDVESRVEVCLAALLEAEINIHYMYAFLALPNGRPLLALNIEDMDVAAEALRRHQIRVLGQGDLAR
ncbi:MAG: acetolactate synthase [Verrucomicrobiae bacterium]|nr:acetolactate synthase [Verrucomicrobiae bacterium]